MPVSAYHAINANINGTLFSNTINISSEKLSPIIGIQRNMRLSNSYMLIKKKKTEI